jgi:hypothetical protein
VSLFVLHSFLRRILDSRSSCSSQVSFSRNPLMLTCFNLTPTLSLFVCSTQFVQSFGIYYFSPLYITFRDKRERYINIRIHSSLFECSRNKETNEHGQRVSFSKGTRNCEGVYR